MKNQIREKVLKRIAKNLNVQVEKISLKSDLKSDLAGDSLDLMELILDIEEDFNVEISDEEVASIRLVEDCIRFVEVKLKANAIESTGDLEGVI